MGFREPITNANSGFMEPTHICPSAHIETHLSKCTQKGQSPVNNMLPTMFQAQGAACYLTKAQFVTVRSITGNQTQLLMIHPRFTTRGSL